MWQRSPDVFAGATERILHVFFELPVLTPRRRRSQRWGLGLSALLLAICAWAPRLQAGADGLCEGLLPGPQHTVVSVVDGETLRLDDGRELRLVGALAPRALDVGAAPGQWPSEVAVRAELEALTVGRTIAIAFGGEQSDRYGRLQAHAFVLHDDGRHWVQGHLLAQGLARVHLQPGNRACAEAMLSRERSARLARRGIWSEAAYRPRQASHAQGLARYRSTFQLVEGRVARVGQARGTIYLNFERGRFRLPHRPFTATLRRGDRDVLGDDARDPSALAGRRVRVRGWLQDRKGSATIDLSAGGHLEMLDDEAQPSLRR